MTGPLAGIRVVDFGQIVSGPMAAMWLGDQGAEVIKVENPAGDPMALLGPVRDGRSSMYIAVNRGKTREMLDLGEPQSRVRLDELLAWADVLIENFRPGVAERLGLGWDRAHAVNPRLVYCSIRGYGEDGPYANVRVYDPAIQATSGMIATQAAANGGPPALMGGIIADKVTALSAAQAITAALYARERGAPGQRIEIAMLDAAVAFHWPDAMWTNSFTDGGDQNVPPYASLNKPIAARDGHVVVGVLQHREGEALMRAIGLAHVNEDPRFSAPEARAKHRAEWFALATARIAELDVATLREAFAREGAVGAVVNAPETLADDPQVRHNGIIVTVAEPGIGPVRAARHPVRFSATPAHPPRPAPRG
jgi:crotonobetainyl-CoA:carnitine CoA-transferase CaiB-like acyl-CoA transferase